MEELYQIKITEYNIMGKLPDPFLKTNGSRISKKEEWQEQRKELYKSAVEFQYGIQPPKPEFLELETTYCPGRGKANSYIIHTGTRENPIQFRMQVFLPWQKNPCPAVICGDGCFAYSFNKEYLDTFLKNGIAFVLFDRTEIAHDVRNEGRGKGAFYKTYSDYNYGALTAWAWGYSRVVDALEKLNIVDTSCITFTGHSRGGKTAILAGVLDERATIVNPNATCAGGCSCNRLFIKAIGEDGVERPSETLKDLVTTFPYWMNEELHAYADKVDELPFDSHYLKALIAPRVLFVSEAGSDIWANPVGSWQTTMGAKEVFKFLDCEENLYWYFRNGVHFHEIEDVKKLVSVIRHVKYGEELCEGFYKTPFIQPELMFNWRAPKK